MLLNKKDKIKNFYNFINKNNNLYIFESKIKLSPVKLSKKLNDFKKILEDEGFNKILISKIKLKGFVLEDIPIKDIEKWNIMIKKYLSINDFEPITSKEFALIHDTHSSNEKNNKSTSVFFKRRIDKAFIEDNIEIILAEEGKNYKKDDVEYLFIVENYKIFELEESLEYFSNFEIPESFINDNFDNIKMIYGSGNKINTKKLGENLFKNYKKIFYFGDYDDEGYKIFNTFSNNNKSVEFVIPKRDIVCKIQNLMNREDIVKERKIRNKNKKNFLINLKDLKEILGYKEEDKIYEMQQEVFFIIFKQFLKRNLLL